MNPPAPAPFLSVVIPFFNSAAKCGPLLRTLGRLSPGDGVELILVDDGSTDDTRKILDDFARACPVPVQVVVRDNGGPGAARNSGFDLATGRFVWFVDSDDTIDVGAIAFAMKAQPADLDLIAWEWDHPNIRRRIAPGIHSTSSAPVAPNVFDPIVANWYSTDFLRSNRIRFPEYCVYEATPIEVFVLPLLVRRYAKYDFIAYQANAECDSVTRGPGRNEARIFDRFETISLGMDFARQAELAPEISSLFEAAFVRLYLWYSINLSKLPDRSWLLAMRVMRRFRDEARRFEINGDPFAFYPGRAASRRVMRLLWLLSAALPSQHLYFQRVRNGAWGRPILWHPPAMPARWRPTDPCGQ
jgi:glycosyltransferase involved in cell wall biosynthesis